MSKSIGKKVQAFEDAVRAHAWRGSVSEDRDRLEEIDREYEQKKAALFKAIRSMIGAKNVIRPTEE